ncbi:MAG: DUF1820 family protein [Acidiferrobacteraceae bacterium]|jgi:hypothetical protein
MKTKQKPVYRILFNNQGSVYELHAKHVAQGMLYAFVEIEDIIFGERSNVLIDPSEERLKAEFGGVQRTYIPLQAVIRIDEVSKGGVNKIYAATGEKTNVARFPLPPLPREPDPS